MCLDRILWTIRFWMESASNLDYRWWEGFLKVDWRLCEIGIQTFWMASMLSHVNSSTVFRCRIYSLWPEERCTVTNTYRNSALHSLGTELFFELRSKGAWEGIEPSKERAYITQRRRLPFRVCRSLGIEFLVRSCSGCSRWHVLDDTTPPPPPPRHRPMPRANLQSCWRQWSENTYWYVGRLMKI